MLSLHSFLILFFTTLLIYSQQVEFNVLLHVIVVFAMPILTKSVIEGIQAHLQVLEAAMTSIQCDIGPIGAGAMLLHNKVWYPAFYKYCN
jgi:hypothetical protein